MDSLPSVEEFLLCSTPTSWVEKACDNLDILLVDHAHCEKKAASTALNLMYRYVDNLDLLHKMSRLAREELRHFEQVLTILQARDIPYTHLTAARYASGLRQVVSDAEPQKLVDILIIGAIIEARSCERFTVLAPHLDSELKQFYRSLVKSESRHYQDYLHLARQAADGGGQVAAIEDRIKMFLEVEKELIQSPDKEFRFHSGS